MNAQEKKLLDGSGRLPPIFVTGYKRSGTTLLGNIIDRHPSVAVFVESFFIPRYYFTQVLFWPLGRDENYSRLAHAILDEPAAKANRLECPDAKILMSGERSLASLVDVLFREWAFSRGKRRWADKSPGYISKLPILTRLFPTARFIHIIRDGRDVWLSLKKLQWETSVVRVASDWGRTVASARSYGSRLPGDRYMEVRYESLVTDPEREAVRIADFLGEPYDRGMIEPDERGPGNPALVGWPKVDRAIDAHNTLKWKSDLDAVERAAFDCCSGELLETLGYEASGTRHPVSRRVSIRLRQLGNIAQRPVHLTRQATRLFARAAARRLA